jgi:hypothetical protein
MIADPAGAVHLLFAWGRILALVRRAVECFLQKDPAMIFRQVVQPAVNGVS